MRISVVVGALRCACVVALDTEQKLGELLFSSKKVISISQTIAFALVEVHSIE